MARFRSSIVINCPVDQVFEFVADQGKLAQWQSGVVRSGSDGPAAVGTRYHSTIELMGRRYKSEGVMTEYDPPRRYAFRATSGSLPVDGAFIFQAVSGGTRVVFAGELRQRGLMRMAGPMLTPVMEAQLQNNFERLKEILEARCSAV